MSRALLIAAAATLLSTPALASTAPDDLWSLAPTGASTALVMDGAALDASIATTKLVRSAMLKSPNPELASVITQSTTIAGVDLLDPASIRSGGVDPSAGAAFFKVGDDYVWAFTVIDAERFGTHSGAVTCEKRGERTVCTNRRELLRSVGRNRALATRINARAPHLRGGIEVYVEQDGTPVDMVIALERGRAQLRMRVEGADVVPTLATTPSPLLASVMAAPATGVLSLDLRNVLPALIAQVPQLEPLGRALRGDVVAIALRGGPIRGWVRAGVADVAAARDLLSRCHELPWPSTIRARGRKGVCEVSGLDLGGARLSLRLRLDRDVLVGETRRGAAAERGVPDPGLADVLSQPWLAVLWGRGLGSAPALPDSIPHELHVAIPFWLAHVDEIGLAFAVRSGGAEVRADLGTVWRNPTEVIRPLEGLIARFVAGDSTHARVVALARKHPQSALAADVAAGASGLVLPLGILSSVADAIAPLFFTPTLSN